MAVAEFTPESGSRAFERVTVIAMVAGAAIYAAVALSVFAGMKSPFVGMDLYDELWLAITAGRLDLPARVLTAEGHYRPDGTGYLYHGIAPLLSRLALSPFIDIGTVSLAPVSIWFWAVAGTLAWHGAFARVAAANWTHGHATRDMVWSALLGALLWLGGPGLLLVSNFSLYHEPIAVAFALVGGTAFVWTGFAADRFPTRRALVLLALFAAVSVHARPNVAIGLYAAALAAVALHLRAGRRRAIPGAAAGLAILLAGGLGYLALNEARFGDAGTTHGSFEEGGAQYGFVFWGLEAEDSIRAKAFIEHGRFNVRRVPANAMLYVAPPPAALAPRLYGAFSDLHGAMTAARGDYARIERPASGAVWFWTGFAALAALGVASWRAALPYAGLIGGVALAAGITLAYPTITLRYQIDLWPSLAALALVGCGRVARTVSGSDDGAGPRRIAIALCGLGIALNAAMAVQNTAIHVVFRGSSLAPWTDDQCRAFAARKGFDAARTDEICRPPRTGAHRGS